MEQPALEERLSQFDVKDPQNFLLLPGSKYAWPGKWPDLLVSKEILHFNSTYPEMSAIVHEKGAIMPTLELVKRIRNYFNEIANSERENAHDGRGKIIPKSDLDQIESGADTEAIRNALSWTGNLFSVKRIPIVGRAYGKIQMHCMTFDEDGRLIPTTLTIDRKVYYQSLLYQPHVHTFELEFGWMKHPNLGLPWPRESTEHNNKYYGDMSLIWPPLMDSVATYAYIPAGQSRPRPKVRIDSQQDPLERMPNLGVREVYLPKGVQIQK